jgi:hypothetical protein
LVWFGLNLKIKKRKIMKKTKCPLFFGLAAAVFVLGSVANANTISGTFTGLVTQGNQPPAGHPHDTFEASVGDSVTGTYSLDSVTAANDSFIVAINGNPFVSYLGRAFVLDANGFPLSGLFSGATVGEIIFGPGVTDALGLLRFNTPLGYQIRAGVTYAVSPPVAAPDAAATAMLLSFALAGLATVRRLTGSA